MFDGFWIYMITVKNFIVKKKTIIITKFKLDNYEQTIL